MGTMYTLMGYYKGPEQQKGLFDHILRREGSIVYHLNPQLYKHGNPIPLKNFGIFTIPFGLTNPTPSALETKLTTELNNALGVGIEVGNIIIPADNISIKLEKSNE